MEQKERFVMVRENEGLNKSRFAELLGFDKSYIGRLEDGTRIDKDNAYSNSIVKKLGVCPIWLESGVGEMYTADKKTKLISLLDSLSPQEIGWGYKLLQKIGVGLTSNNNE